MVSASPLDSNLAAQIKRDSMTRCVQVPNKLSMTNNFSGSPLASHDYSLLLLLNDAMKKSAEYEEESKDGKDKKNNLSDTFGNYKLIVGFFELKETA